MNRRQRREVAEHVRKSNGSDHMNYYRMQEALEFVKKDNHELHRMCADLRKERDRFRERADRYAIRAWCLAVLCVIVSCAIYLHFSG